MGYIWNYHFQTPGQIRPEATTAGLGLLCNNTIGGLTPETGHTMFYPADTAARTRWRSRSFTMDPSPTNYIAFGFWAWFHNVDINSGKNNFIFWDFTRNNISDVSLELLAHASGHEVKVLNAAGTGVLSFINPFTEEAGFFVEVAVDTSAVGSVIVRISPTAGDFVQDGVGSDFQGDTGGNTVGRILHRGQTDLSADTNSTTMRIGPGYVNQDIADAGGFLGNGQDSVALPGLEYYGFRNDDTTGGAGCKKDGTFPGDAVSVGTWDNTSDDDSATHARFTGDASADVGSIKEMATASRDGPAPHFRPDDTDWYGVKYNWNTVADSGGSYLVGWGSRSDAANYFAGTKAVAVGTRFSEQWLLPSVNPGPTIPSELFTFAMGGFVDSGNAGKNLDLKEMYAGAFGAFGMGGEWPDPSVGKEHHMRGVGRGIMRGVAR